MPSIAQGAITYFLSSIVSRASIDCVNRTFSLCENQNTDVCEHSLYYALEIQMHDHSDPSQKKVVRTKRPTVTREAWNERYAAKELVWGAMANRTVASETASLRPGEALDLACGEGRNAVWLANGGWTVHAVDFSDVAIKKATALAEHDGVAAKINFECADICTMPLQSKRYDLILMSFVQLPQARLAPIVGRAARAVAPGGAFLLVGHDTENLTRGRFGPQDPELLYRAEEIVAALGDVLTIEKACRVHRQIIADDGFHGAIDCLVRARAPAP